MTGLTGNFEWALQFSNPPSTLPDAPPAISTAFREQLGVKVDPTKGPFEFLVIDALEEPTPD